MLILRWIYSLLIVLLLPLIFLRMFLRSLKLPAYRQRWAERLGFVQVPLAYQDAYWFHAVSVGEVEAMIPIIRAMQKQSPGVKLVFSTTTPTGGERLKLRLGKDVQHFYLPFDAPWCVQLFLRRLKPKMWIILESELWPNWLHYTSKQCPIILVNARLSERSVRRYQKFSRVASSFLVNVTAFLAQSQREEQLFRMLCPHAVVQRMGNTKWDCIIPEAEVAKGKAFKASAQGRPVWIAASTHEFEETIVLESHRLLLEEHPNLLLILVPRHPDRFKDIAQKLHSAGWSMAIRSRQEPILPTTQLYLADTMGELLAFYAASDVAFVGGSFAPKGGHNMLEALACGLYSVMGPDYSNFKEIGNDLIKENLLKIVSSSAELAEVIALELNADRREQHQARAKEILSGNQGAAARCAALVLATNR